VALCSLPLFRAFYNSVYLEVITALYYNNRDGVIHACVLYYYDISMLVFHNSNCVAAIKRMRFYYHHMSIFTFFHVFCVFLVTAMHA